MICPDYSRRLLEDLLAMAVDKDRLYKKLEHIGEFAVRENLADGIDGENRREHRRVDRLSQCRTSTVNPERG